jgi:hypothetical protein
LLFAFLTVHCGGAPPRPAEPAPPSEDPSPSSSPVNHDDPAAPSAAAAPSSAPTPPAAAPASAALPTDCGGENSEGICAPPKLFVTDVCGGFAKPDIALALFAKGSPWTRAYLRLNVDAWYTASRSAKVNLKLDEEVIVMHHPNPSGGIIVNGGAPYDVMRLDGNCATLSSEEVTLKRPPSPKHPPVPWKLLDPRTRETLLQDSAVSNAKDAWDESCHTPACAKAENKLTVAILDYMARGGKVPLLTRR